MPQSSTRLVYDPETEKRQQRVSLFQEVQRQSYSQDVLSQQDRKKLNNYHLFGYLQYGYFRDIHTNGCRVEI